MASAGVPSAMYFVLFLAFVLFFPCTLANCPPRNYTSSNGTIASPNQGGKYPSNQLCTYDIRVPKGKRAKLSFSKFDVLGAMPGCVEDYVEIFTSCQQRKIGRFCKCGLTSSKPFDIYSIDECITVVFKSDNSTNGAGFEADFTSAKNDTSISSSPNCSNPVLDTSGTFFSPLWPNNYPKDIICNWTLNIPAGNNVTLSLMNVNIERHITCNEKSTSDDLISISGQRDSQTLEILEQRICSTGIDETLNFNFGKFRKVFVTFFSDPDNNVHSGFIAGFASYRTGFEVNRTSENCSVLPPVTRPTADTPKPTSKAHAQALVSSLLLILIAAVMSFEWPVL